MTDEAQTPKPKTRTRKFPIRQFSNLLDEFLEKDNVTDPDDYSVRDLQDSVNADLLAYYKS